MKAMTRFTAKSTTYDVDQAFDLKMAKRRGKATKDWHTYGLHAKDTTRRRRSKNANS